MNVAGSQFFLPFFLCLLHGLLALYEKTNHPLRPRLPTLFIDSGEFSNVMSVAQRMRTVKPIFYSLTVLKSAHPGNLKVFAPPGLFV
jgi:hypothetical protein